MFFTCPCNYYNNNKIRAVKESKRLTNCYDILGKPRRNSLSDRVAAQIKLITCVLIGFQHFYLSCQIPTHNPISTNKPCVNQDLSRLIASLPNSVTARFTLADRFMNRISVIWQVSVYTKKCIS